MIDVFLLAVITGVYFLATVVAVIGMGIFRAAARAFRRGQVWTWAPQDDAMYADYAKEQQW